jgi:hypothetical protein
MEAAVGTVRMGAIMLTLSNSNNNNSHMIEQTNKQTK